MCPFAEKYAEKQCLAHTLVITPENNEVRLVVTIQTIQMNRFDFRLAGIAGSMLILFALADVAHATSEETAELSYVVKIELEPKQVTVTGRYRNRASDDISSWGNPRWNPFTFGSDELVPEIVRDAGDDLLFTYIADVSDQPTDATSAFFDDAHLRAWGWNVLPTPVSQRPPESISVDFDLPQGWAIATSFGTGTSLRLSSLADLRVLTWMAGDVISEQIEVSGHSVIVMTRQNHPDGLASLVAATRAIIEAGMRYAGREALPGRFAVGFDVGMPAPSPMWAAATRSADLGGTWLSSADALWQWQTLGHELGHFWQFGFTLASYMGMGMWFSEGVTDYLGLQFSHRAGLYSDDQFAAIISESLQEFDRLFALADSDETKAPLISYPTGMLRGFYLDLALQKATDGRVGLSQVFRVLFDRHLGQTLNPDLFRQSLIDLGGPEIGTLLDRLLDSNTVRFPALLEGTGFVLEIDPDSGQARIRPGPKNAAEQDFLDRFLTNGILPTSHEGPANSGSSE